MNRLKTKKNSLKLRKARIRKTVTGTAERPRMSVHISSQHVTAQLVDDEKSNTLVHITTVGNKKLSSNMTERATWVGTEAAKRAKLKKIKKVVFDRNGKLYHGRVKALADAAREGGLEL